MLFLKTFKDAKFVVRYFVNRALALAAVANLLSFALVRALVLVIDATEVGDDDRNRKCYDEHAAERTDSADYLADYRLRHHVSVPAATQHIHSK